MANPIVNVTVNVIAAPAPNNLQKKGAIISQGATTLGNGNTSLITQVADLTAIAATPKALASIAWAGNLATATTTAPHGLTNGDVIPLTIAGAVPSGYDGSFQCTITGASTFTYPLAVNPGTTPASTPGTYIPTDSLELNTQVATFFAQGSQQSVYVLELGAGTAVEGIAALSAYITANPGCFYRYLLPREWDAAQTQLLPFISLFESTTAKTYFHITSTLATYTGYTNTMKSAVVFIESPNANPAAEFGAAWPFWRMLSQNPSATNKAQPLAFAYGFGVTPYPTKGNAALFSTLKAAYVNWAGTGAEGGISDVILFWGTTMDGRDGLYWYAIDWAQINIDLNISNAVINGSNSQPPLDYNQDGINSLQAVAAATLASGVSFGLLVGTVKQTELSGAAFDVNFANGVYAGMAVINAIPFATYVASNPSDYPDGIYDGFSAVITTARGFVTIGFVINVTDFV
jgi:hypothetical protein